jgi:3-dehydroquinate synthase
MERVKVELGDRSYPILIGDAILPEIGGYLPTGDVYILTNPVVDRLYGDAIRDGIERKGSVAHSIVVPDGETSKDFAHLLTVYDALVTAGAQRTTPLVAVGGGVIGDLGGFCAATFMRGIPFVQVPTTLLSQVDSSVGGKTAINHPRGKNLIGAFYQPRFVFIDINTLDTLPRAEFISGLAEVLKYGIVLDGAFFELLETRRREILKRESRELVGIIKRSVEIKADVVGRDEREAGVRSVLNFGHTMGHAVERLVGYGRIRHGEAVAKGMAFSTNLSLKMGLISAEDRDRIVGLLAVYGFDLSIPTFSVRDYRQALIVDKKSDGETINFVLIEGIGRFILKKLSILDILDFIEQ